MSIEQQIEELRAELSVCIDGAERAQIEEELQAAKALLNERETAIEAQIAKDMDIISRAFGDG